MDKYKLFLHILCQISICHSVKPYVIMILVYKGQLPFMQKQTRSYGIAYHIGK